MKTCEEAVQSAERKCSLTMNGEAGRAEIGALVCDGLMLGMFLYNQFAYGLDMLFLIFPLFLIGLYLLVLCVFPEKYRFTETALEIQGAFSKTVRIPYESVFNLDARYRDGFVNLLQENKAKVYYTAGKSKRLTVCRPKNARVFAEELKKRCPEFDVQGQKSNLEVFFNEQS